jgi:AP-3 complex subunit beta
MLENGWQHGIPLRLLCFPSARDLTIEAAQSVHAGRSSRSTTASRTLPFSQVQKLLDSRNDREILEGLRKVVSVGHQNR